MPRVLVAGVGMVKVDRHFSRSLRDLAAEAAFKALGEAGGVDAVVAASAVQYVEGGQLDLASYIAGHLGLRGVRTLSVEGGEASGLAAVEAGWLMVKSGAARRVLVVGADKLTDYVSARVYRDLQSLYDVEVEALRVIGHAGEAGLLMRLYMERYGVDRETLSYWPALMHSHAKHNPYAMLRFAIDPASVPKAMPVAEPITLLDAFPLGDGAAAVLLVAGDDPLAGEALAEVTAAASASGPYSVGHRDDPLRIEALERASAAAGLTPGDLDVVEVCDSFTINGILHLEALGLAPPGKAAEMVAEGAFTVGGDGPLVNASGGCKARGHPVGATGVYQVAEAALQLAGEFPGVKAEGARVGAAACYNGVGSSGRVVILRGVR